VTQRGTPINIPLNQEEENVMSHDPMPSTDTRDMACVHNVFRRALTDAPGQLACVTDGGTQTAEQLGTYLGEVLWLLHAHHSSEDELMYPLLVERVPESKDLFARMDAQHVAVAASVEYARQAAEALAKSGSTDDAQALADACRSVLDEAAGHLSEEEAEVVPIASRSMTSAEWGALPGHVLSQYPGTRLWLLLGLIFEEMPDDLRDHTLAHVPPPVSEMWFAFGSDAFRDEMAVIRAESSEVRDCAGPYTRGEQMKPSEMNLLIERHLAAERAGDTAGSVAVYVEDVEHDVVGNPTGAVHGKEAAQGFYEYLVKNFQTEAMDVTHRYYGEDFCVMEHSTTGTVPGEFFGVQGNGRQVTFRMLHVWEFRDGLISRENVWFDGGALIAQLTAPGLASTSA
jgi:steroid delta-isomerase-like uncharacterized protein